MRLYGVSKAQYYPRRQKRSLGQGVVEYAGALVIVAVVIGIFAINSETYADMLSEVMEAAGSLVTSQI